MGFKPLSAANYFALNIAARALVIAALGFVILYVVMTTQYYATAVILAGLLLLAVADMGRILSRLDAPVVRIMEALAARSSDMPIGTEHFLPGGGIVGKTITLLQNERKEHARQTIYLQSLADTVTTALIVIAADGRITLANRAAQMLAGEDVSSLCAIKAIGKPTADELLAMGPGTRSIVKLANGQQMLASMAQFSAPGSGQLRLLALQSIVGELDAVELKAWRDMTRVLAHEMMNSLTPISSLSESLSHLLQSPEAKSGDAAEAAETIARRSKGLIHFVERYRKIADLPEPELQPLSAEKFVRNLDTLMAGEMARRKIAYSSKADAVTFEGDADLLNQAVINLLRNAMDAVAAEASPQVNLSCTKSADRIAIAVSDNGPGLPADHLDDIFVPFFTTKQGGSGIGLSLARQIALAHRGQIEVETNAPHGTIFRILLPS
jgi:nitrogen fixation/metabolism regulation signal transduction histidine kinase